MSEEQLDIEEDEAPEAAVGPTKQEMATWGLERRLRRIQKIFVRHSRVIAATAAVEAGYRNGIRLRESTPVYLVGDSRCGKSELLKRFLSRKAGLPMPDTVPLSCEQIDGPKASVVYLDCHNGATPLQACITMLNELYDQRLATRGLSQPAASALLIKHFLQCEIALFVIDEAQKMVSGKSPNNLTDWITSLRNAGSFRIIIAGDSTLGALLDTNKVLRDSKKALVALEPFAYRTEDQQKEFGSFLKRFNLDMPFVSTPLTDLKMREPLYFATRGRPGTLAIFLETATEFAFERVKRKGPPDTLEVADLSCAFDQMMARETRMLGINPFTHEGAFPDYARTVEEEVNELQRALLNRKGRGRQRAAQLG